MARPSSRDPSAAPRAQPSGPGPTPHLIPWTPPPAQTTAPIPRSRSGSPDWPGPQAPPPRPRGAPASHSRGPRATKAAAGREWSRGSGSRPGPPSHLPTLGHTRPRASPSATLLTLQPPAPLPPRGGATAALGPPPTAAPPSSSSSSPKGGRAAAAQAGAQPPRKNPGRPRPRHSPVGGASRGEGPRRAGPRSRVRSVPPLSPAGYSAAATRAVLRQQRLWVPAPLPGQLSYKWEAFLHLL